MLLCLFLVSRSRISPCCRKESMWCFTVQLQSDLTRHSGNSSVSILKVFLARNRKIQKIVQRVNLCTIPELVIVLYTYTYCFTWNTDLFCDISSWSKIFLRKDQFSILYKMYKFMKINLYEFKLKDIKKNDRLILFSVLVFLCAFYHMPACFSLLQNFVNVWWWRHRKMYW